MWTTQPYPEVVAIAIRAWRKGFEKVQGKAGNAAWLFTATEGRRIRVVDFGDEGAISSKSILLDSSIPESPKLDTLLDFYQEALVADR